MPSDPSFDAPRDEPLLPRVAAGDGMAVGEVIDRYRGLVWSLARRLGVRPADADDAVQEVFIDLWKSAERYDPAIASEKTFVATIARRRLIDRQRRAGRRPEEAELPPAEVLAADAGQRVEAPEIEARAELSLAGRALARLRPEERRALLLNVYHGYSHSQIADRTGLPLGTVKTYVRRGLIRVRELLDQTAGESAGGAAGGAAETTPES